MPMFQAKPRIVEAFLFNEQRHTDHDLPPWYVEELLSGRIRLAATRCLCRQAHFTIPIRSISSWSARTVARTGFTFFSP